MSNPNADRLRVGFIGAGGITRKRHVPGLLKIDGVELVAVCNRSLGSAQKFARDFDIANVYGDWRQVVEDPLVDAVFIGTWPYKHSEYAIAALDAGKHVFCQARLAMDASDARRMVDKSISTDRTTMVCPPPHGMYYRHKVREIVDGGHLGAIRHITVESFTGGNLDLDTDLNWRQRRDLSGLNTLTLGIMVEVVADWFNCQFASVQAVESTYVKQRLLNGQMSDVERPDSVFVLAEFSDGSTGSLNFSSIAGGASDTTISAYGTDGTLHYVAGPPDSEKGSMSFAKAPGWDIQEVEMGSVAAGGWTVEDEFIQAIRDGRKGVPSWETGMEYMRVVEAVDVSARSGRRIFLDDV